jgi:pyruvate dehydrogenase E1 component alpha subunit
MGTSVARSSAGHPLVKRADAYDMAGLQADGMDLDDVRAKTIEAVNLARTESLPTLMEIRTYRYRGHSMSDPGNYRTREEIEKHKQEDPILLYRARLIDDKVLDDAGFQKIEDDVTAEVQDAYDFADQSPEPDPREAFDDIFTPEDQITEPNRDRRYAE